MVKAIIFDCFGVLVGRGFGETYRQAGGDPAKDHDFIEDTLEQANLGLIDQHEFHRRMTDRLGISLEQYHQAVARAEHPNQELLDYIAILHKDFKTAVLSNVNKGVLEHKIAPDVLAKNFDVLIISAEIGIIKPDPRIYHLAAQKLGVEVSECLFIDDQERYCEPAMAEGMQALRYISVAQLKADIERLVHG